MGLLFVWRRSDIKFCLDFSVERIAQIVNKTNLAEDINPINFLLFDKTNKQNSEMLSWQLKHLEFEYGLKPTDDLAMIRILL